MHPTSPKSTHWHLRKAEWRLALAAGMLAALLSACADAPGMTPDDGAGSLSGRLETLIIEGQGREAGTIHLLHPEGGGSPVTLRFRTAPEWATGTLLTVYGQAEEGGFHVTDHQVDEGELAGMRARREALLGAPEERERTIAFVRINLGGAGLRFTAEEADAFMFGTTNPGPTLGIGPGDRSVTQYYEETSYGLLHTSGAVEGEFASEGFTGSCRSEASQVTRSLQAQISEEYDHYIWFFSRQSPSCDNDYGWGSLGSWSSPSSGVWFSGGLFDGAITHELGHNLGYQHASSIDCGSVPFADDPETCETNEYGSLVSVMGNLSNGQMMGLEKWYAGWFQGCNGIRVRSSGTFTLHAIENQCAGGIQTLQVPMPVTDRTFSTSQSNGSNPVRFYYLELRSSIGLDTGMENEVMVHASDDIREPDRACARNVMLDMNPSSNSSNGMSAGQSYEDPAGGISFTVDSIDGSTATVSVTIEGGSEDSTCMDGSVLVGTGPATCDETGGMGGAGAGGMGGLGGMAGLGGTAGAGGVGAAGGAAGAGGLAGAGGVGTAGSPAVGGGAGIAAGGSSGVSGAAPFGGNAGSMAGAGGSGVAGALGGGVTTPMASGTEGCSCRTVGHRTPSAPIAVLLPMALAAGLHVRRARSPV